jgi:type VII secretion-associated serine protease mycosin
VTVAVIDTGVDAEHPDLRGSVLAGIDAWSPGRDGRRDTAGHGTAMAALIAGHGHGAGAGDGVLGVAPQAKILPVGAYPPGASTFSPADLAVGIRWAVDHGAQIVCLSITGGSDPAIGSAVAYALSKGATLVAAAGNKPRDQSLAFPAAYPGVIAVSAINRSGTFADDVSISDFGVLLSAPGADVTSAAPGGGYAAASGTSSAAALVAGAAALVKAKYPQLAGAQIYQRLKATAVDKGQPGHDEQYGYGVIDPLAALTRELPSSTGAAASSAPVAAGASEGHGTAVKVLLSALIIAGYALVAALVVWLVVRLVRRRRVRSG